MFAGALLVATLLHLDRFSQNISFYTWMTLYATTPFVVAWLWWMQRGRDDGRLEGPDAGCRSVRVIMLAVGAASLVTGAVLFLAPTLVIPVWAWDLTPLTAQVMGAVLSLPGVVARRIPAGRPLELVPGAVPGAAGEPGRDRVLAHRRP